MNIVGTVAQVLAGELAAQRERPSLRPASAPSIVAAVSGGADSTALLYLLQEYCDVRGIPLAACHYTHGLRPPAAGERELAVVREMCARLGVALLTGSAPRGAIVETARREGSGIEAAARDARYRFFRAAARAAGATIICTGHTEDDQVETIFMAVEKGVEEFARSGIPVRRELSDGLVVLRPLLFVSRMEIERYVRMIGAHPVIDLTNTDQSFSRNRVRAVVQRAERQSPGFRHEILKIGARALYRRRVAVSGARALAWKVSGDRSWVDAPAFFAAPRETRLVSLYGEAHRRQMWRASSRISARFFAPLLGRGTADGTVLCGRGVRIVRERDRLVWSSSVVRPVEYGYLRRVTLGARVELPDGPAIAVLPGKKASTDGQASVIELKGVREPVLVRPHRSGDVIATGSGSRTVAAILAEWHVPLRLRSTVPVLCDREGILAVVIASCGVGPSIVAAREESVGSACSLAIFGVETNA